MKFSSDCGFLQLQIINNRENFYMVLEKKAKQIAINKQVAHTQPPRMLSATDFVLWSGGCLD